MKTATLLFGLAACAASPSTTHDPQYPLCGADGAPACGNIGQAGRGHARTEPVAARPAPATPTPAPAPAPVASATPARSTHVLLQASSQQLVNAVSATPLINRQGELACGNVMGKGSRSRVCRDATGAVVSRMRIDADGVETQE